MTKRELGFYCLGLAYSSIENAKAIIRAMDKLGFTDQEIFELSEEATKRMQEFCEANFISKEIK